MSLAVRTAKNTVMVAGGRILARVVAFYVFLVIVRSTSTDDFGRFSLLVIFSSLVSIVVDLGLRPLFIREVAKDRALLTPYLNSILSVKLVMAVPAAIVLWAAIQLQLPEAVRFGLPATLALLLGASFSNQMRATFYAVGELRYELVSTIGESLVLLVASIAVATLHLPWWCFIWAYAASYYFTVLYAAVIAVVRFGHRFAFDLKPARLASLGRESLPFALTFLVSTLYYKIDQPLIRQLTQPQTIALVAVGIYAAAYKFLDAATFLPQALMDPIYPTLSRVHGESPDRLPGVVTKAYKMLAFVSIPVAVSMFALAEPIIHYGAPGYEATATPVLRVLAAGVVFLFVNNAFLYTLNAMGRQSESTRLAVMSLIVNVTLNVVLIPQASPLYGGYMGAAWATGLTELGLFVGGWFLLRRHLFAVPIIRSLGGVLPAGVLCAVVMSAIVLGMGPHLPVYVLAFAAGMVAYGGGLLLTHAFSADELALVREATRSLARR